MPVALVVGLIMGYGIAEWNFAHDCSDVIFTAARFEESMDPFLSQPYGPAQGRLRDLRWQYALDFAKCQRTFVIR
jgi:hypothetical protein